MKARAPPFWRVIFLSFLPPQFGNSSKDCRTQYANYDEDSDQTPRILQIEVASNLPYSGDVTRVSFILEAIHCLATSRVALAQLKKGNLSKAKTWGIELERHCLSQTLNLVLIRVAKLQLFSRGLRAIYQVVCEASSTFRTI